VRRNSVRGQYGAGIIGGTPVKAYREEPGVAPDSTTETYVAMQLGIHNWRWAGVPFYLRTGKRFTRRTTEITIQFKYIRTPPREISGPGILPRIDVVILKAGEPARIISRHRSRCFATPRSTAGRGHWASECMSLA
jgi:hypothetical protein